MTSEPVLIIGVGNPDRGDDGAGRKVIELLRDRLARTLPQDGLELAEHSGETTSLVEAFAGREYVAIIDAASSGDALGTYRRFEAADGPLPADLGETSSHGFGVAQAIELARALGSLPERCQVYAIEGAIFDMGASLSPAVLQAAEDVAADITRQIDA
ncbi:MAG: hydrogenase maturation protease [Geminicoccaceae bacterium]